MKLNLIYYKNILDIILARFIDDFSDSFTKINNCYVLSTALDRYKLKKYITIAFKNFILELNTIINNSNDKIIIIGACYPKNNILLSFNNEKFPNKLQQLLIEKPEIKYILKESDILIDIDVFNSIVIEIFNELFTDNSKCKKTFCNNAKNIIFVTHNHLDCYMVFKAIKWIYGQSNCINIWKNKLNAPCNHIIALNDLISKYSNNKRLLNSDRTFKTYVKEIQQYLNSKLGL